MAYWIYIALATLCAISAFSMAVGKNRSVLSWTFSCFSMPFLLVALFMLPALNDAEEPETGYLVMAGMACALICSLWSLISLTGLDRMLMGVSDEMPTCNSEEAHSMVTQKWAAQHAVQGVLSVIVGYSNEHAVDENVYSRLICEAGALEMDGHQINLRYVFTKPHGRAARLDSVSLIGQQ